MPGPDQYSMILHYFPQLIGVIYLFVFWPFLFQIKGLFGKQGILPMTPYLNSIHLSYGRKAYYYIPSVFWVSSKDKTLVIFAIFGTLLSILTILGIFPLVWIPILFILHLSITTAGQEFLSFGWESFFLEISLYSYLLLITPAPTFGMWWCLNLLLFRFHFEAGISKLMTNDSSWNTFTGVDFHYLTQPIPNTVAWHAKKLPMWFQKLSCVLMFIAEIPLPFLVFGTEDLRLAAFFGLAGLQFFIWLTGNFSYLNHMTVIFCLILLGDSYLEPLLGKANPPASNSLFLEAAMGIVAGIFILGQCLRILSHFYPKRFYLKPLVKISPFHILNRYGIFAVMTTKRYEIVIEGSDDGEEWKEYLFKWKPSELSRRPRRVSPYQPRLDWQIWFLPFTTFRHEPWVKNFLYRLLEGSPDVLKLIRENPFPDCPPKFIRAQMYDYEFTTRKERRETGDWWKRTYVGSYSPTYQLA